MIRIPHILNTKRLVVLVSAGAGMLLSTPAIAQTYPNNPAQQPENTMPMQQPGTEMPMQQPGNMPMQQPGMDQANPSANSSIVDIASNSQSFNTLTQAIQAAGLTNTLTGQGPYTVFAPTDEAFAQLPEGALQFLLQPENQDLLRQVLTYHVVSGEVPSSEVQTGSVEALGGGLAVRVTPDNRVIVNNASVVQPDIQASNGVIHAVNRVLLPETLQQRLASRLGVQEIY